MRTQRIDSVGSPEMNELFLVEMPSKRSPSYFGSYAEDKSTL
jgi:hypothetical protein